MRDTNRIDPESFAVQTPFSLSFALSWLDFLCFPSAQPTSPPPPTRCSLLTFNTTSPRRGKTQGMLVDVENAVGGYRGSRSQYATQHHSHRPASSLMPVWQELTNDEYGWPAGAASDRPAVFCLFFFVFFFLVKRGIGLKNFRLLFACCTSNRQATEVAKIRRHSHKPLSTARRGRQLLRLEPMRHET